ncbi:MAG TPA: zf-HC2 domain-containing protein [Ktedonobacteraceae bacterium]|nr:zf-HC2 domain-containing protein [Ktedonobacteraceae bacterium]
MNELQPQKQNDACLDRGLLVSLRDGELSAGERAQAETHLASCPYCSADERSMRTASKEVYALLAFLEPSPAEVPDTTLAFSALQSKLAEDGEERHAVRASSAQSKIRSVQSGKPGRRSPWWIAVAAVVVLALVLLPNAGALASEFLALFSVRQFQPVSINPQSFRNGIGEDLQNFGDINIQSGNLNSIQHPNQKQMEQDLGFKLLLPAQLPPGVGHAVQFTLIESASGTFTFSAAQTRAYLKKTGQGNIAVPPQLDGATYAINLAPGVIINYGNSCQSNSQSTSPAPSILHVQGSQEQSAGTGNQGQQNTSGSPSDITSLGCSGGTPFYIVEMPSPVIKATGKASLKDLLDFALSLPKLSPGARLLLQSVNLATGEVPLPIPPQVQAQKVSTHGVTGVMMTDSSLKLGAVIWQAHGIIYAVAGATSNGAQLLASANSLQ